MAKRRRKQGGIGRRVEGRSEWEGEDYHETAKSLARTLEPFRPGAKPIKDRKRVSDCDIGDLMQLEDGRLAIFTSTIAGAPFGRFVDDCGKHGQFERLPDVPCKRLKGHR